jgi:hypothetical protein
MDGTLIGIIGVVAGVAGVIVAWYSGRRSVKSAAAQQRLATHSTAADWLRDLRQWASEAIDVLAEASYTCSHSDRTKEDCSERLRDCRYRLSALVDRGRFFLPNQNVNEFGTEKPSAYRGWRHAALDPLVAAERVVSGKVTSGRFATREKALIQMRREFVSAIQRILAPDLHNREIARMIHEANEHRAADRTLGGLLPDDQSLPTGADRLLFGERHIRK